MEVVYPRCCGLDVHKRTVVACLIVPGSAGQPRKEIRTFETLTDDLLKLADWLGEQGVTHVAMEATGVYWKPVGNLLEGNAVTLLLVNAAHIKAVPGRKTDGRDCEWGPEGTPDLLRHGLLRGSDVPDRPQRELRELTRDRPSLIRERTAEVNRLQKTLEGANLKRAAVASDVLGKSGREILTALVQGQMSAEAMAQLARGRLREKIPHLERALAGRFGPHQRFLIAQQLAQIDFLDELIAQGSREIAERMRPFAEELARLDTIPGMDRRGAENIRAEIGTDLSRFPSADHLASWAGMVPGSNESAGKPRRGKTRKGDPWLRTALIQAAHAAGRTKDTYLRAQDRRLAARRGKKKAAVAVGHSILVIADHLLTRHIDDQDLGPHSFAERDREAVKRRLVRRLEDLGDAVTVTPAPVAA
jgi:transposase